MNKLFVPLLALGLLSPPLTVRAQQPPNYPQFQVDPFKQFVPALPPANLPLGANDFIPLVQQGVSKRIQGNQVGGGCPTGVLTPGIYNPINTITVGSNGCIIAISGGAGTILTGGGLVLTGGGAQLSE